MTEPRLTLVGDGVENPANAAILLDAADMFEATCRFIDRCGLRDRWLAERPSDRELPCLTIEELGEAFAPRVAFDNLPGASSIYGFSLPAGPRPALLVGNERRGLSRAARELSQRSVELPMVSRHLNCLNVAAAAAVLLYYAGKGGGGKRQDRRHPERHRPEILLLGAADPFELGSSIRSACALGWSRIFVEDRAGVWFGCDRGTRSEGRGAARRGRNPIRIVPTDSRQKLLFEEVIVLTVGDRGEPLHSANLARGPEQLLAVPDESALRVEEEDWERLGRNVRLLRLPLPGKISPAQLSLAAAGPSPLPDSPVPLPAGLVSSPSGPVRGREGPAPGREFRYHLRLPATILMAEAARQIGRRPPPAVSRPRRREPLYDHALELLVETRGEIAYLEDLADY